MSGPLVPPEWGDRGDCVFYCALHVNRSTIKNGVLRLRYPNLRQVWIDNTFTSDVKVNKKHETDTRHHKRPCTYTRSIKELFFFGSPSKAWFLVTSNRTFRSVSVQATFLHHTNESMWQYEELEYPVTLNYWTCQP